MRCEVYVLLLLLQACFWSRDVDGYSYRNNRTWKPKKQRYPVVLVPGDGGSQLQAKLDKPEVVHYFCNKKTDNYFDLWLNLELLLPYVLDCWVDNMRLIYDNKTRMTTNAPGVDIRVPGFGNTSTVEFLDPSQISPSTYFSAIVNMLVSKGYTRGVDVRGAPYDFRKAPNELKDYLENLENLIVETYKMNGRQKVYIICHSMGCPVSLYLLNQQSQAWKDKYVSGVISLAGAWGGAVKALKVFASGENLGVVVINPLTVRPEQRSSPSLAFVAPSDKFWSKDDVLVSTPKRNYTVDDYRQFFEDINYTTGWEMWKDVRGLIHNMTPPGVEIHCLHGANVSTIERLYYADFSEQPTISYGDGDGTVNMRSLRGCLFWQDQQKAKVYHKGFQNVDHMAILSDPQVLFYIQKVLTL
ncbi:group XV phospholipase A2-like isoform X1 [Centruroides sculpturatus]|uniref:group XV phospholipase A2-like isoform X1 n=2 Tax=Centruroides sculpturatus TaxID=218467 RepID=UPI000C6D6D2F|nr:group XV phospholipase A2-like isoform X1 [Centruroides sculpturatus]